MPENNYSDDRSKGGSKISNTEWGLVISALFVIDAIQLGLNLLFQFGVIANRFIDVFVGMAWPFYLYMRGVNLNAPRTISIALTFLIEEIPNVDSLPLWGLDGVFMLFSVKAEEQIKKRLDTPLGKTAIRIAERRSNRKNRLPKPEESE